MIWLKHLLLCFFLLGCSIGYSQNSSKIKLKIKLRPIEHYKHHLKKVDVIVFKNSDLIDSIRLKGYKLKKKIIYTGNYKILFKKEGYVAKHVVININKNRGKKYKLKADISLFPKSNNKDLNFLDKEPVSIAYYDKISEDFKWDFEYNRSIIEKIIHAQTKSK